MTAHPNRRILPISASITFSEMAITAFPVEIANIQRSMDRFWTRAAEELRSFASIHERPDAIGYAKTDVLIRFADGNDTANLDVTSLGPKGPSFPASLQKFLLQRPTSVEGSTGCQRRSFAGERQASP